MNAVNFKNSFNSLSEDHHHHYTLHYITLFVGKLA